jgi:hypothetical protein
MHLDFIALLLGRGSQQAYDKYGILFVGLFSDIAGKASYFKDKRKKAKRKAAFIGKLFETNGGSAPAPAVPDKNKRKRSSSERLGRD